MSVRLLNDFIVAVVATHTSIHMDMQFICLHVKIHATFMSFITHNTAGVNMPQTF